MSSQNPLDELRKMAGRISTSNKFDQNDLYAIQALIRTVSFSDLIEFMKFPFKIDKMTQYENMMLKCIFLRRTIQMGN